MIDQAYTDASEFPQHISDGLGGFSDSQKQRLISQLLNHQHRRYLLESVKNDWEFVDALGIENLAVHPGVMRPEVMTSRHFAEFLFLNPQLFDDADVIDVGAGCGIQGIVIAKGNRLYDRSGIRLAFCDIAAAAVRNCRENLRALGFGAFPVVRGDFGTALDEIRASDEWGLRDFGKTGKGLIVVFNQPFFCGTRCDDPAEDADDPSSVIARAWNSMVMPDADLTKLFERIVQEGAKAIMPFCYFTERGADDYRHWNDPSLIADACGLKVTVLDSVNTDPPTAGAHRNTGRTGATEAPKLERTNDFLQKGRIRYYLFEPKSSARRIDNENQGDGAVAVNGTCWSCQYAESGRRRSGKFHEVNYGARIDESYSASTGDFDRLDWDRPARGRRNASEVGLQDLRLSLTQEISDNVFHNLAWHVFAQFDPVKAVLAIYTVGDSESSSESSNRIPSDMMVRSDHDHWHQAQAKYTKKLDNVIPFDMTKEILSRITDAQTTRAAGRQLDSMPFYVRINSQGGSGRNFIEVNRCSESLAEVYTDEVVISFPGPADRNQNGASTGLAYVQKCFSELSESDMPDGSSDVVKWLVAKKIAIANGYLPMIWDQIQTLLPHTKELFMYLLPLCTGSQTAVIPVGSIFLWCESQLGPRDILAAVCIAEDVLSPIRVQQIRAESIRHATKAAFGAIASRNLSHNFGSHIIPALTSYSWPQAARSGDSGKAGQEGTVAITAASASAGSGSFGGNENFQNFLHYLQTRMDFISRLTSEWPTSRQPLDLVKDVFREWAKQAWLLDNIVRDNGYSGAREMNNMQIWLRLNGLSGDHSQSDLQLYPDCDPLPAGTGGAAPGGVLVGINGGMVGAHAVYAILENLLRNTAKHSNRSHGVNGPLKITITVEPDPHIDGYVRVSYLDNITRASAEDDSTETSALKKIQDAIGMPIIDPHTLKVNERAWGYKEIRLAAEYLVYPARYKTEGPSVAPPVLLQEQDGGCQVGFRIPVATLITFLCGKNGSGNDIGLPSQFTALSGLSAHRLPDADLLIDSVKPDAKVLDQDDSLSPEIAPTKSTVIAAANGAYSRKAEEIDIGRPSRFTALSDLSAHRMRNPDHLIDSMRLDTKVLDFDDSLSPENTPTKYSWGNDKSDIPSTESSDPTDATRPPMPPRAGGQAAQAGATVPLPSFISDARLLVLIGRKNEVTPEWLHNLQYLQSYRRINVLSVIVDNVIPVIKTMSKEFTGDQFGLTSNDVLNLVSGRKGPDEIRRFAAICNWIRYAVERNLDPGTEFNIYIADTSATGSSTRLEPLNINVHRMTQDAIVRKLLQGPDPDRVAVIDDHRQVMQSLASQDQSPKCFFVHNRSESQKSMKALATNIPNDIWTATNFVANSGRPVLILDERIWDAAYSIGDGDGAPSVSNNEIGMSMAFSGITVPLLWINNGTIVLGPGRGTRLGVNVDIPDFVVGEMAGFRMPETDYDVAMAVVSSHDDSGLYAIRMMRVVCDPDGRARLEPYRDGKAPMLDVAVVHQGLLHGFISGEHSGRFMEAMKGYARKVVLTSGGGRADIPLEGTSKPLFLEFGTLQRCVVHDLCKQNLMEAIDVLK